MCAFAVASRPSTWWSGDGSIEETPDYSSTGRRENAWGLLERSPQTPKNFQNVYKSMFNAMFHGIFVIIILGEPALLLPEIAKTPSLSFALTPFPALR